VPGAAVADLRGAAEPGGPVAASGVAVAVGGAPGEADARQADVLGPAVRGLRAGLEADLEGVAGRRAGGACGAEAGAGAVGGAVPAARHVSGAQPACRTA